MLTLTAHRAGLPVKLVSNTFDLKLSDNQTTRYKYEVRRFPADLVALDPRRPPLTLLSPCR